MMSMRQPTQATRTFLLQSWITARGTGTNSVIQDERDWVDLNGYADSGLWVDISSLTPGVGGPVTLTIETSATHDESGFRPSAPPIAVGVTSTPMLVRTASTPAIGPMARWMRWKLTAPGAVGQWDATFRIRGAAGRSSFWQPTVLAGCSLWLRADLGITLNGTTVSAWADSSTNGNNASQGTAGRQPVYNTRQINGQPTLFFDATLQKYMPLANSLASLSASHAFVVHRRLTNTESTLANTGFWTLGTSGLITHMPYTDGNIYDDGGGTTRYACGAPQVGLATAQVYEAQNQAGSWKNLLNGLAQSSSGTNTVGLSTTPVLGGNVASAIFYYGDWAETILYNRILNATERALVINYLNGRYALGAV